MNPLTLITDTATAFSIQCLDGRAQVERYEDVWYHSDLFRHVDQAIEDLAHSPNWLIHVLQEEPSILDVEVDGKTLEASIKEFLSNIISARVTRIVDVYHDEKISEQGGGFNPP